MTRARMLLQWKSPPNPSASPGARSPWILRSIPRSCHPAGGGTLVRSGVPHFHSKNLELVDKVHAGEELVARCAVIVSPCIPGMIESDLWPEQDGRPDVLGRIQGVFCIFAWDSGALPLFVIQQVGSKSYH